MCGIISIIGRDASSTHLENALGALSHRGPDDHGTMSFDGAVLGHTRLAIIDLSPSGHQPMKDNAKNIAISFNGEIYNYKEIRKELEKKGHHFSTQSDTEVILKAYQEYGADCPKHLDGMFAFVIWDDEKKQAFLARDRFGKKPLYYSIHKGTLFTGSELKALFAAGLPVPQLELSAVDNYLALGYIPPWKSVYTGIFQIPPAHTATFNDGSLDINRYWHLEFKPIAIGYEEAKEETRRLLKEAVKKRMLAADVEVGALLSGGVDSTLVCLLAQEFLAKPLKTFSLGYGDYRSELPYALEAAKAIGSEHHTLEASSDMVDELEKVITYFDEPHADNSDFPQHLVSELAAKQVKVALSGDGGDELFLGYGWHNRHEHLSFRAHTYEKLFLGPLKGRVHALTIFKTPERIALWNSLRPINNEVYQRDAYDAARTPFDGITTFDLTTYLPGQLLSKVDRTGMMHGLEVRSPLLDTDLAEFVVNLPRDYKLDGGRYKRILKDILAERMPKEFVNRRKQGFGAPGSKWLRDAHMSDYAQTKLGAGARIRSLLSGRVIDWYLKDFYERGRDRASERLWWLLCLEIWLQKHSIKIS